MAVNLLGDPEVAKALYETATGMGVTSKTLTALFEAAIVESGMKNISRGPDGSLGVLQQRPSWGTREERLNPAVSARKFCEKAAEYDSTSKPFKGSAGSLAQKVQVSAFPLRYDAVYAAAQAWILASGGFKAITDKTANSIPDSPATTVKEFFTGSGGRRIVMVITGGGLVLIGAFLTLNLGIAPVVAKYGVKVAEVVK